jgi:hypothetical protein
MTTFGKPLSQRCTNPGRQVAGRLNFVQWRLIFVALQCVTRIMLRIWRLDYVGGC